MANIYFQRILQALIVLSAIVLSNHVFSQEAVGETRKEARKEAGKGAKQEASREAKKEARRQALNR